MAPQSAGVVLEALLAQWGLQGALARHSVVSDWDAIVESSIARHAKALKVVDSTLHVAVDCSVWMHELAALKPLLLHKINARLPTGTPPIRDIRFQQRSWAFRPTSNPEDPPIPEPNQDEVRLAHQILSRVEDPELKSLLSRILEKDRRLKWRRGDRRSP
jgi:hypothetical protein